MTENPVAYSVIADTIGLKIESISVQTLHDQGPASFVIQFEDGSILRFATEKLLRIRDKDQMEWLSGRELDRLNDSR